MGECQHIGWRGWLAATVARSFKVVWVLQCSHSCLQHYPFVLSFCILCRIRLNTNDSTLGCGVETIVSHFPHTSREILKVYSHVKIFLIVFMMVVKCVTNNTVISSWKRRAGLFFSWWFTYFTTVKEKVEQNHASFTTTTLFSKITIHHTIETTQLKIAICTVHILLLALKKYQTINVIYQSYVKADGWIWMYESFFNFVKYTKMVWVDRWMELGTDG